MNIAPKPCPFCGETRTRLMTTNTEATKALETAADHHCVFSVTKCNNEIDTLECSVCGRQKTAPCNFDEDMS
jgi:hypothetical protein